MNSYLEVLIIKIKVKSCLKNINENTEEKSETNAIKNKNKITYHDCFSINKINIYDNKIMLVRENDDFIHTFNFEINKETTSEYYIKEYASSIEVKIKTTKLVITDNKIEINYIVKESNEEYNYILDMEWNKWV